MTGYHIVRGFAFDPQGDDLKLPEGWKPFAFETAVVAGTSNFGGVVIARKWCPKPRVPNLGN